MLSVLRLLLKWITLKITCVEWYLSLNLLSFIQFKSRIDFTLQTFYLKKKHFEINCFIKIANVMERLKKI